MSTKTDIAKLVAHSIVTLKVGSFTKAQLATFDRFEEDDITVIVAGGVTGALVANQVEPYTDAAIDKIVARFNARKEARNNK